MVFPTEVLRSWEQFAVAALIRDLLGVLLLPSKDEETARNEGSDLRRGAVGRLGTFRGLEASGVGFGAASLFCDRISTVFLRTTPPPPATNVNGLRRVPQLPQVHPGDRPQHRRHLLVQQGERRLPGRQRRAQQRLVLREV